MHKNENFKIGDRVAMLNEPISGTVVKINNKQIVILADDGFEYECKISEIVTNSNLTKLMDEVLEEKILSDKTTFSKTTPKAKTNNRPVVIEVDLHIHELVSSEKGMSNFEMLSIQLTAAKNKLEQAIKNRNQRIVFIHGIGEGVLKRELIHLFKKYPVKYYDASYQKYGQGATEVYIYQNKK